MKPPKKPFIVEFKQARRVHMKPRPSIWGTIDLNGSEDVPKSRMNLKTQPSPKPVTLSDSPEPPMARRILPTLPVAPGPGPMEIPAAVGSIPERDDDLEAIVQAPVASNSLATDLQGEPDKDPKPRLRRGKTESLPAGQRWKRRLPRILREEFAR